MDAADEAPIQNGSAWWVYVAFAAWAVLAGPVNAYVSGPFVYAMNLQVFAGEALCGVIAAAILFVVGATQRQKTLDAGQWKAVLVLLVPQWCSVTIGSLASLPHWLRGIGWGAGLLLLVAAPLWLGLLSAMGVAEVKVPRATVGAAIAGVFAVCLVAPVQAYSVAWGQAAMLAIQVLLSIAAVMSWVYAAPRLMGANALMAASGYLLLSAVGNAVFAVVLRPVVWQSLDWGTAWEPLLMNAALTACVWLLWFWLLKRMTLAAFSMRALAAWAAGLMFGFIDFGWTHWRSDIALLTAVGAIVVGLTSRAADEQPTALGLGGT